MNFKDPKINLSYLKSLVKNSIEIEKKITQDVNLEGKIYSLIEIKFTVQNILETAEIKSFELAISDEENEFVWMGNKKTIFSEKEKDSVKIKLKQKAFVTYFFALTDKQGTHDLNKFTITLIPKKDSDKPIIISDIPHPIIVQI